MYGINEVTLMGNIGQDVTSGFSASGTKFANVSLATSKPGQKDESGERKEYTEWHRIVFVGKLAEVIEQYGKKGSRILVKGELRTRKWEDKHGEDRYTTEIWVTPYEGTLRLLDGRPEGKASVPAADQGKTAGKGGNGKGRTSSRRQAEQHDDEEVPF